MILAFQERERKKEEEAFELLKVSIHLKHPLAE